MTGDSTAGSCEKKERLVVLNCSKAFLYSEHDKIAFREHIGPKSSRAGT